MAAAPLPAPTMAEILRNLAPGGFDPATGVLSGAIQLPDTGGAAQTAQLPDWATVVPSMAPRGMDPVVAATNAALQQDSEKAMSSAYDKAADAARQRVQAILARTQNAGISDRDKWLALALGGARMAASRNPYFFGAAGEGAETGLQNFADADRRAKQLALQQGQQEMAGEQFANAAGSQAENRVIRREDIAARAQARLDALKARAEELDQRSQDRALDREARAQAAAEALAARREIAQLYAQSRVDVANIKAAARRDWAPEPLQKALDTWDKNKDDPELGPLAWTRVQKVAGFKTPQEIEIFAQRSAATDLEREPVPPKDPEAYKAAKVQQYKQMMGAPAPAAPTAAAAPTVGPKPGPNAAIPARPTGVPPAAKFSPSQGKWWWQDASGNWQSN